MYPILIIYHAYHEGLSKVTWRYSMNEVQFSNLKQRILYYINGAIDMACCMVYIIVSFPNLLNVYQNVWYFQCIVITTAYR